MTFTNEAQRNNENNAWRGPGAYGFTRAPRLLFSWGTLFQTIISQAGTYALTAKFHTEHCAIHKCEGGCRIDGVDELVLLEHNCYWDWSKRPDEEIRKMASLITEVVLAWNPEDPIDSMLNAAAKQIGVEVEVLREAVGKADGGGKVFGGNALSDFFRWNPFSDAPIDREYERYCLVKFEGYTEAQVDAKYADQDLGRSLLSRINAAICAHDGGRFHPSALCCSPRRDAEGKLRFWVNTGTSTQIDGWQTREQLEAFITSGEKLVRRR